MVVFESSSYCRGFARTQGEDEAIEMDESTAQAPYLILYFILFAWRLTWAQGFYPQTWLHLQGPGPRSQALAPAEDTAQSDTPFPDDEGGVFESKTSLSSLFQVFFMFHHFKSFIIVFIPFCGLFLRPRNTSGAACRPDAGCVRAGQPGSYAVRSTSITSADPAGWRQAGRVGKVTQMNSIE